MKVVHVITGLGRGGAEGVLHRLVDATPDVEHAVVSLTDEGVYGPRLRASVHALGMRPGRFGPRAFRTLRTLLRDLGPDVVQTWLYHADLVGGLASPVPVIWTVRNLDLDRRTLGSKTRAVVALNALLSRRIPAAIVYNAERTRAAHERAGFAADVGHVIPNGFDTERFRPDPDARARVRAEWGVPDGVPLVGCVARAHPHKDHENLLAALDRVRAKFVCALVGEGVDRFARPYLVHAGPRDDIPAVMNALDLHVLASCAESSPNVVAEAMACGTPVVATDVGDTAALVGGVGAVVPPRDPEALAAAIESRLTVGRRSADARDRIVMQYSLGAMCAAYRRLWEAFACAA